jgi:PAS domain S-box-containing protein
LENIQMSPVRTSKAPSKVTESLSPDGMNGLLAAIVDSSDDAIVSKDTNGFITSWNKSAERMFGYPADEAIGKHISLIIPSDRLAEEDSILARIRRGERVEHFETVRVRKDGTSLDISLTISPVKDATGHIVGAAKIARDITERRVAERTLAERALLLDRSSDAILVRDAADRVVYWNNAASEVYGYTSEEAMGRVTHELLQTEFPEPRERIVEQLHRDGRWAGELVHRRKDGRKITVASRWVLDQDRDGNRNRVLETNNDITRQKQSEKALLESEARLRALAEGLDAQVRFRTQELEQRNLEVVQQSQQLRDLSNRLLQSQDQERRHIARELHDSAGQIITALLMQLAALGHQTRQNPPLAKGVEEAETLLQQLNREIRTMSYLLHPPLLDETGLAEAIRWYIEGLSQRSGLAIEFHIAKDVGRLGQETEMALFRIVQECLTNVHRHSGSGKAAIRIARSGDRVSLEVADKGKGLSADKLAGIRAGRSGVGITGIRERVRHLEGTVEIDSNLSGTRVSVVVPATTTLKTTLPESRQLRI